MNKKILILILIIFVVTVVILVILGRKRGPSPKASPITTIISLNQELQTKIFYPHLSQKGEIYYLSGENYLRSYETTTKKIKNIWPEKLLFAENIFWSPNDQELIVTFRKENLNSKLLNLRTRQATDLKIASKFFAFSPKGTFIAYQALDEKNQTNALYVAYPNGNQSRKVLDLPYDPDTFYQINWLTDDKLVYLPQPTDVAATSVNILDLKSSNQKTVTTEAFNYFVSPNEKYLAILGFNNDTTKLSLSIYNENGEKTKNINITLSSRTALSWSPDGNTLIASHQAKNEKTADFYLINPQSGQMESFTQTLPNNPLQPENLMMSRDNQILFFISEDLLYRIELQSKPK